MCNYGSGRDKSQASHFSFVHMCNFIVLHLYFYFAQHTDTEIVVWPKIQYLRQHLSVIVYTLATESRKAGHFSFDISATGSSTIKNLADKNQPTALAVLRSLNVIEAEEVAA